MESILHTVKVACGVSDDCTSFDEELIMYTNMVMLSLYQLGVGPSDGFKLEDPNVMWNEFITDDDKRLEAVKTYTGLKVRMIFDPPTNTALAEALNKAIAEAEWRISSVIDYDEKEEIQNG